LRDKNIFNPFEKYIYEKLQNLGQWKETTILHPEHYKNKRVERAMIKPIVRKFVDFSTNTSWEWENLMKKLLSVMSVESEVFQEWMIST